MSVQQAKKNMENLGFHPIEKFLSDSELESIRKEVDFLFSKNLVHGHAFSVFINPRRQEIPHGPAKIHSINLFEKALDVMELLKQIDSKKYKNVRLLHIAIYKEHKNPFWLRWHSDIREGGLTRCQIVLRGGQEDSGAFVYINGSHQLGLDIPYRPNEQYLEENKNNMTMMNKPNGTAFVINTLGYHSRVPVIKEERISIMIDFADADFIKNNPKDLGSNLLISFHQLTDRILKNIELFKIDISPDATNANCPDAYRFNQKFGGYHLFKFRWFYFLKKYFVKSEDY